MKVKDVMTADVRTVRSETSLKEAAEILVRHGISGLPVVDAENHVVGVLSEGDILFKERGEVEKESLLERWLLAPLPDVPSKPEARTAGEAMSVPAVTIGPRRPLAEAATVMIDRAVKRLPVVDDQGSLVGIVTRADLVRAFVRSDDEIVREIREEVVKRTLWMDDSSIEVTVDHGEVRIAGTVETKLDAELIPALVQRVPGVVSVLSKLRWQEEQEDRRAHLLAGRSF